MRGLAFLSRFLLQIPCEPPGSCCDTGNQLDLRVPFEDFRDLAEIGPHPGGVWNIGKPRTLDLDRVVTDPHRFHDLGDLRDCSRPTSPYVEDARNTLEFGRT